MADNVTLNAMTGGATVAADEVTDGTLGTVKVQYVKLMDGTLDGTTKASVDASFGLKVDVARSVNVVLGTGSNTIGSIASIGTSVVPGTAATNLGKAEDAAHASGDTGVFVLGVRNDNLASTFTSATGDYSPIAVDSTGEIYAIERSGTVIDSGSVSVTTSAASFIASSNTRRSVTIQNLGTDYVFLGKSGVAVNTGIRLSPGQTVVIDRAANAQLFAIASSGTQTCCWFSESD